MEGEERPLGQWDFVHCPPETGHMIVGAGDGPALILAMSSRNHIGENCNGGAYTVDEAALRHDAGVEEETDDANVAYADLRRASRRATRRGGSGDQGDREHHDIDRRIHRRPDDGPGKGLGEGGERLHYWVFGGPVVVRRRAARRADAARTPSG